MRLRPHHLLCTQGYSGKGYSSQFVENMDEVVRILRGAEPVPVEIVFGADDLCRACPHRSDSNACDTQNKVNKFDQRVIDFFHLEEKVYIYQDLIQEIDALMTDNMMNQICHECSWYPISACKKNVCKGNKEK